MNELSFNWGLLGVCVHIQTIRNFEGPEDSPFQQNATAVDDGTTQPGIGSTQVMHDPTGRV